MGFLEKEFPEMVEGYKRLFPGAYAPPAYVTAVKQLVGALQDKYEVHRRARRVPSEPDVEEEQEEVEAAQAAFDF